MNVYCKRFGDTRLNERVLWEVRVSLVLTDRTAIYLPIFFDRDMVSSSVLLVAVALTSYRMYLRDESAEAVERAATLM